MENEDTRKQSNWAFSGTIVEIESQRECGNTGEREEDCLLRPCAKQSKEPSNLDLVD
jgi:hypothetical protein